MGVRRTATKILAAVLMVLVTTPAGWALYQFDDLFGPSGVGGQWMVITTDMDTGGDATFRAPVDTQGNLALSRASVYLTNGRGLPASPNGDGWAIHTLFLVIPEKEGNMRVSFDWLPRIPSPGAAFTQDVLASNSAYQVVKTPLSASNAPDKLFDLRFIKKVDADSYGSVRGSFIFHQNPDTLPSQTLQVPFIVANVCDGTAEQNPLLFRSAIRESVTGSSTGDIVAYDRFTWKVTQDLTVGTEGDQVFVPISKLPIDSNAVNYRLSTEIANYTGIRYAMQRYDGYVWNPMYPNRWAFDIPSVADVPASIYLDELSHIPPGLVTTYNQSFNVVSGVKEAMHVYPVDPASGFCNLTISHRSIFGLNLGIGKDSASPHSYSATGFRLLSAGTSFLSDVAKTMDVSNVQMPEPSDGVMSGAVSYAYVAGDVVNSFVVDTAVPGRMTGRGNAGLLPLNVTFNLPKGNQLVAPKWDALLREWRSTGTIRDTFASLFGIYLRDSYGNNLDLIRWLQKEGAYAKTVRVFLDEQRNVITVNFIAMLMDGPSSVVRLVNDKTTATDNTYIVAMDGDGNNKWNLTFFTAPANYVPTDNKPEKKDGGGGGCNAAPALPLILPFLIFAFLKGRQHMKRIMLFALLVFAFCTSAEAATTVTSDTELAAAIANPASGDIVLGRNIMMNASFDIPINRNLTISAGGGDTLTGDDQHRIFIVNSNVTFGNIRFNNAKSSGSGGAINVTAGTVMFNGCTFTDNSSDSTGGAINVAGGSVSFSGTTTFTGNSATSGGAINSVGASAVTLGSVSFTGNKATSGSGGAINAASVTATGNVTFTGNEAGASGGAINATGAVTLSGGSFSGNKAGGSGGAISAASISASGTPSFTDNEAGASGGAVNATGAVTLSGGSFSGNKATADGGAISSATVALSSAIAFSGNTAGNNGGAVATTSSSGSASLNGGTFSSNTAGKSGGAVYAAGTVTFTGGSFSSNKATGGSGGAIHTAGGLTPPATAAVTFSGNTSFADGGAVYSGQDITLTGAIFTGNKTVDSTGGGGATYSVGNSTFTDCVFGRSGVSGSGNSAENSGGAVSCGATLIADNCSFSGNTTKMDGGALYIQAAGSSSSRIDGSLLRGNTAGKDGGAVHFGATNLSIMFKRSMFSGNNSGTMSATSTAGGGGAVYVTGTGTFDGCTFTGNTATAAAGTTRDIRGGAVYAAPTTGSTSLTNCTFTLNEARSTGGNSQGGAIYLAGKSSMLYCTLTNGNTAASRGTGKNGLGGGLYVSGGPLALTACAAAGNEASFGGDIFRDGGVKIASGGYSRLGSYGITSQGFATDYPWGSDSNVTGAREYDQEGVTQNSMFGNGVLADNATSGVNVSDITVGATGETGKLLTVALVIGTTNPALDQIPNREGNLFATRVDQRNLQRPQPTNGLFDVGALESEQGGGPGPDPDPEEYYVDYVKMSGIPNTMTKIGQTCSLTAIVYPSRANQGVTWSSSLPNVAHIDAYGNLVSLARGTTTVSATSVGMMSNGKRAADSLVLNVTDEMTYTNVHPDVWRKLGGYNSGMQPYSEQLYLVDSDPAVVSALPFQSSFTSAYGVAATQVTDFRDASAFDLGSKSSYAGNNWESAKPSIAVSLSSLSAGGGSLLPLEFTWSLSWKEVSAIMGRTVTKIDSPAELFGKLKILFEATDGSTMPVVDQDGEYGIAARNAVSSGALTLTNGNNGLTLTLDILLGDAGGNDGRPSLIGNRLVVADNVVDGTAGGSMWLLKRTGSGGNQGDGSGSGGGGGCNGGFAVFVPVFGLVWALGRRKRSAEPR